jgi:uncharacterized protein YacL
MIVYRMATPGFSLKENLLTGTALGLLLSSLLIGFDIAFRRCNLRAFNIAIVGLFIGYLMGKALVLVFNTFIDIGSLSFAFPNSSLEVIRVSLFLGGTYLGTITTLKASDELYISLPFVRFSPGAPKIKLLLTDISALADSRIIDIAATGFLDRRLVIPRFLLKETSYLAEIGDEASKAKAKKVIDSAKKLKEIPHLEVKWNDTDFPEVQDTNGKFIRLAKLLDADILSADMARIQNFLPDDIRILNLHTLSNSLKPITQRGESLKIKIQRHGKEPCQGIGYLDDGAMVVVNGGGKYIGEMIDAQVLSVKHTSSGRMIFCNACDEEAALTDFLEHSAHVP